MNSKKYLFILPLALSHLLTACDTSAKPNIVLIIADDMGWGDLSCHGHPRFRTPNIDSLAMKGIDFHHFYVPSPVCSPTRAGILTGSFPARYSINNALEMKVNIANGSADWLDPASPSMARMLKEAGYQTAHFGKWHLVEEAKNTPDAPMAEEYGYDIAQPMRGPWTGLGTTIPQTTIRSVYDSAVAFVRKPHNRPFFLNMCIHESHLPIGPTEEALNANKHIPDERERRYAGVITDADNGVGRIVQALKETGQINNTLIIFLSDNGPAKKSDIEGNMNYYNFGTTGGKRGTKGTLYDGGVCLPLIVSWQGRIPENIRDELSVISAVDIFPTLCSLIGGILPSNYIADGEVMKQAFFGKPQKRTKPIFWFYGKKYAMREGDWKIITDSALENAELFNLVKDPAETTNVATENPGVVNEMIFRLSEWQASLPPSPNQECISGYRTAK